MGTLYEKAMEGLQRMAAEVRTDAEKVSRRARAVELMVLELSRQLAAVEQALEKVERLPARVIVLREGVAS